MEEEAEWKMATRVAAEAEAKRYLTSSTPPKVKVSEPKQENVLEPGETVRDEFDAIRDIYPKQPAGAEEGGINNLSKQDHLISNSKIPQQLRILLKSIHAIS